MTTRLALPIEIISQIIGHLSDCQILSLYNDIPILASNPLYLPVLKNNYNYYCNDFELVEKLLAKGFKIAINVGDNQMLTRILEHPHRHLIYKMKLEYCKITTELLDNNNKIVDGMYNLLEIVLHQPLNFGTAEYNFVVKKLKEGGIIISVSTRIYLNIQVIMNIHLLYILKVINRVELLILRGLIILH